MRYKSHAEAWVKQSAELTGLEERDVGPGITDQGRRDREVLPKHICEVPVVEDICWLHKVAGCVLH